MKSRGVFQSEIVEATGSIRKVWESFGKFKKRAVLLLIMLVIASFLEAIGIALLLPILEIIIGDRTTSNFGLVLRSVLGELPARTSLVFILVIFFLLLVIKNVFIILTAKSNYGFLFGLRNYWMKKLFEIYVESDYNFILNNRQGALINNIIVEVEKAMFCLKFLVQFLSSAILTLFMVCVLFVTSWQITLCIMLFAGLMYLFSNKVVNRYSRNVGKNKIKYAKAVSNYASETITFIKQVKTFGLEPEIMDRFNEIVNKYTGTLTRFRIVSEIPKCAGEMLTFSFLILAVMYVLFFSHTSIKELVPIIGLFIFVGNRINVQSSVLVNSSMQMLSNVDSLYLVDSIVKSPPKKEDHMSGADFSGLQGDIVLQDITFSYENSRIILDKVNVTIPHGKFVLLIGPSGSGKSTFVDLLLRLQKPDSGRISINGENVNNYNLRSWRKKIGFVSQDILLLNTTIRENILVGKPNAGDEEIYTVARKVNAHKFIESLSEGYETVVGDRGLKLSGGQRQRVVLARSLIREPDLLILDEATSDLDQKLEGEIIDSLKESCKGKTVIFITHRLATASHADFICVLEGGKIVQSGTYEEVIGSTVGG